MASQTLNQDDNVRCHLTCNLVDWILRHQLEACYIVCSISRICLYHRYTLCPIFLNRLSRVIGLISVVESVQNTSL
jgi:hypothetical protein